MASSFPIFEWKPDLGAERTSEPLATTVSFGDGYELRVGQSLNRVKHGYTVTFTRTAQEALQIASFLEDRAGLECFEWTDPLGETRSWVCRKWNGPTQQARGVYVIEANFEEVFEEAA